MKQVIYREVISIDGRDYTVSNCDYSESIAELITDEILADDNQEIINHIVDDITNSQWNHEELGHLPMQYKWHRIKLQLITQS